MTDDSDHLRDADQTAKDRSYSPSSDRETAARQDDTVGNRVPPGTGGPDDSGDPPPVDEGLDPSVIAERGHRGPGAGPEGSATDDR
ncbi:hypothetical protein [Leifsonia sp. NPDC080035]|uniref:Uncharacterized protein n=1 Tax=Leifsonia sp. NPDC080035 TaxID=3143936 RepID=A0AAU7GF37_9MICO